jgi:hypothetical protein
MMKANELIVQRLRAVEMQRMACKDLQRMAGIDFVDYAKKPFEIKYEEINAPSKVISKADINGKVISKRHNKIKKAIVSVESEKRIKKNGMAIAKSYEKKNMSKMESYSNKALDLSKEDVLISQRFDIVSSIGLIVGSIILLSAIIFLESLGGLILPMFTLGLGLILTWLLAKIRIEEIRKEHHF